MTGPQEGRRARFEALAAEVLEPLRRYLARRADPATADDALGDALLVLWRRLDDVPAGDGALPWAYAVARGCLANAERAARRQRRVAGRVAALDPPTPVAPATGAGADDDRVDALRRALAGLSDPDAELLRLWAWEQLEPHEIATVLDLEPGAARVRLHRARARLREALTAEAAGPGRNAAPPSGQDGSGGRTG